MADQGRPAGHCREARSRGRAGSSRVDRTLAVVESGKGAEGSLMPTLGGARVALLEARMTKELADLVERFGGKPYCVPAVREARLPPLEHVAAFIAALCAGRFSAVVLLTGVGVMALLREADSEGHLAETLDALRQTTT